MGRYYRSGCCSPYGYPYPYLRSGCGPCAAFSKCYKYDDCCYDSCNSCCNKTLFTASTTAPSPDTPFQAVTNQLVTFNATSNCYCLYSNNSTFTPKKKGTYNFNATVPILASWTSGTFAGTVTLSINKNGSVVSSTSQSFSITSATQLLSLSLSQSICLCPCDSVTITLTTTISTGSGSFQYSGTRTFCGSKC